MILKRLSSTLLMYLLHSPYCVPKHKNMLVDFQKDIEYQFSISNDLPGEEH